MQKELLTKTDYAAVGEEISHELAADFVTSYRAKHANDAVSFHMGRNIIEKILAQPGCMGMRFYNALNEEGQKTLVYVGIDAQGKDLLKIMVVKESGALSTEKAIVADRMGYGSSTNETETPIIVLPF
jgi:hypothetical protein